MSVTKGSWTRSGVLNKPLKEALKNSKVIPSTSKLNNKKLYGKKGVS